VAAHDRAVALMKEHVLPELGLDRVSMAFMGGAPCPPELVEFYVAAGLPLREAYGLTEATGFAAIFPTVEEYRIGTVGRPVPGVELRLADDGEILLRSPWNMKGYRNDPERTREAIDPDGWLHTGDIAQIDDDGFVRIVDRKKDIIINSYGKNMSPSLIEAAIMAESRLIGTAMVVGDGRPFNVALLCLDPEAAGLFARERGLAGPTVADWATSPEVLAEVTGAIDRANGRLSRVEQIKRFRLLDVAWAPDSDELTPTMKFKRNAIVAKYADDIAELYDA
jgi:long-chain acyl-CoA synthetase